MVLRASGLGNKPTEEWRWYVGYAEVKRMGNILAVVSLYEEVFSIPVLQKMNAE